MPYDFEEQKQKVKEAMDTIIDATNIMSSHQHVVDAMIESLGSNHRTLQASFWRVMMEVMKEYSEASFDLRNEGAVKMCQFITEQIKERPERAYIPHI